MLLLMVGNELIREARLRARMTQAELADRLGTHQSVVARWESGRTHPDFDTVVRAVRSAGFDLGVAITEHNDHDLALVRRELRLAPHERLAGMVEAVRKFAEMTEIAVG